MLIERGTIVKSLRGRDSERFFVVLELMDDFAKIADGKLRLLEKPKLKKLKHIKATNTVLNIMEISTNNQLKKLLEPFLEKQNN